METETRLRRAVLRVLRKLERQVMGKMEEKRIQSDRATSRKDQDYLGGWADGMSWVLDRIDEVKREIAEK
jgi:hypothetical protein